MHHTTIVPEPGHRNKPYRRDLKPPAKRISFQTKAWAKEHGLGDPVAGVVVTAQHK